VGAESKGIEGQRGVEVLQFADQEAIALVFDNDRVETLFAAGTACTDVFVRGLVDGVEVITLAPCATFAVRHAETLGRNANA
jgi:hypothetical protein